MKSYSQQAGPNLAMWRIKCQPNRMISHNDACGGILVQDLGRAGHRARRLPHNSPGKVFCYECGHRVGKSVTRALRGGTEGEQFYFPDRQNYEIMTLCFDEEKTTYRYWEWQEKKREEAEINAMLDSIIGKEKRPKKGFGMPPLEKIKGAQVIAASDDWLLDHPKVLIRFPKADCCKADVEIIAERLSSFACRNYDKDELIEEAMRLFSAGGVEVVAHVEPDPFRMKDTVTNGHKFIFKHARGLVIFDQNHWDVTAFRLIRQELRAVGFDSPRRLKQWVEVKIDDDGMEQDSVKVFPINRYQQACDYMFQTYKTRQAEIDF